MGLLHVRVSDQLEERLRNHTRRKGDLTKIVTEAIELWLSTKGVKGSE